MSLASTRPAVSRPAASGVAIAAPGGLALLGAGDPGASRVVYAMVIGLLVIGVALVLLGVWIVRQTRPDLEVLAPLERMGDGDWKKRDLSTQRRMLDELRPAGAQPLTSEPMPPPIDADFEAQQPVTSFSDLGPGVGAEHRDPAPPDADLPDAIVAETGVVAADAAAGPDDDDLSTEGAPDDVAAGADDVADGADHDVADGADHDVADGADHDVDNGADGDGDVHADGDADHDVDDDADQVPEVVHDDEALSDPRG